MKPLKPNWPPVQKIWPGQMVCIVGSGQSARAEEIQFAQRNGCRVIAINTSFRLVPDADLLYGADRNWWNQYAYPPDHGLSWKNCPGIKVSAEETSYNQVVAIPYKHQEGLSLNQNYIHTGGMGKGFSGFQAINLAILLGARKVLLFGYDSCGEHWHGPHPAGLNNPDENKFHQWPETMQTMTTQLDECGVEVVNCSIQSKIECFPKISYCDAIYGQ